MIRLALLFALLASFAHAGPSERAQAAIVGLETAIAGLDQAKSARDRVAALTETITAMENGLTAVRDGLRRAAIREQALTRSLEAQETEVARLIGVLQIMSRAPAPLLLLHPAGPTGTARSGMILSEVTPALQAHVTQLRTELEEVSTLRSLQQSASSSLRGGLLGLQTARTTLSKAISERAPLPKRFIEDRVQTALLIAASETLDGFASGLSDLQDSDPEGELPTVWALKGHLPLPVQGTLLRRFDESDAAGIRRPGLVIATRPQAIVTAPAAATIRYLGPLLDYGNVIILEPASDTLLVFAGLSEVYGAIGEVVPATGPLGLMGGKDAQLDTDTQTDTGSHRTETLYIEVREGPSPVDPASWFALNKE